ncbi:MAG: hypothetical protein V3S45_08500, partial [Kiloniellales bacterium]
AVDPEPDGVGQQPELDLVHQGRPEVSVLIAAEAMRIRAASSGAALFFWGGVVDGPGAPSHLRPFRD